MNEINIRKIRSVDDPYIASIIRDTLKEFGANHPGTVYYDESTDHLASVFEKEGSVYFIAENEQGILGGAGIYPTEGLPAGTCELVKMYLIPQARNKGLGKQLITNCLEYAKNYGYGQVYLETMPELKKALVVYERMGFQYIDRALGNSGHFGCSLWMLKKIN